MGQSNTPTLYLYILYFWLGGVAAMDLMNPYPVRVRKPMKIGRMR